MLSSEELRRSAKLRVGLIFLKELVEIIDWLMTLAAESVSNGLLLLKLNLLLPFPMS